MIIIKNNTINILMLLGILYLVFNAYPLSQEQTTFAKYIEIFLVVSFLSTAFFKKHLFGIGRQGIPALQELDCEAMGSEWCRDTCLLLKEMLTDLEYSGALRSNKGIAWRIGGYIAGFGGLLLALITSTGGIAALGVLFCLPSVFDWLKDNPKYWEHWQNRSDAIQDQLSKFLNECLNHNEDY